ncbi:bile acid:sodium symporter family protein [Amycolatopsis anabasis]|uniref:bile acid:sodium symporter family protein n=1 Tax=Amycolatopsis anabasis TaxID=1840409 RepID=UPI00131BFF53|nr:bile acid:sodium symporter family protein [Amycolatopsis anabasis]
MIRTRIDPYVLAIVAVAAVATVLPIRGEAATAAETVIKVAIGALFFLYGSRLPTAAVWDGVRNWRLHLVILLCTFAFFPVLGLTARTLAPGLLPEPLYGGLIFLCVLPSTVQSAITFTSLAGGNVAAAVCSASFSNVLGVLITPVLTGLLLTTEVNGLSPASLRDIALLLLVPFVAGQLLRPVLVNRFDRHRTTLRHLDRGVILAVVYSAFSEGAVTGVWHRLTPVQVLLLVAVAGALLAVVLGTIGLVARWLGFTREERITIVFCGSNKSLASGLPMATVLFAGSTVSLIVLPLMLYHQIQLIVCAWLARRFAAMPSAESHSDSAS